MKKLFSKIFLITSIFAFAQDTHTVIVGPGNIYTPSELTISTGDVVNWISEGGYHDVNFNINSITNESFGNPIEIASASLPVQAGPGEMGSITFNNPGTYNYDCSVGSHALMGMVGSITVTSTQSTTVVDIVVNSEDHTTLEAAVVAAGLVETLSGEGPFTVFAPTDDAFALLPEGLIAELLEDPSGDLTTILTHHVHSGNVLSSDLTNGMMVPTIAGTELTVSIIDGMVQIDNANVIVADVVTDNGVVHVIDAVLVPEDDESTTVVDIVVNSEDHTTLEAAVVAAGLVETLSGEGPFTVFAPTDDAFALLPEGLIAELLEDPSGDLTTILTHHVHSGNVLSSDLTNGMMVPTIAGTELTVSIIDGMVQIDNANVIVADVVTDNGVVHVIDAVLVPNNLNINDINKLPSQDDYLYSIDIMGRRITNTLPHQIIFDVYSSGKVIKRFSSKN